MEQEGFSADDYNVLHNSCNSFTEELARRVDLFEKYPSAILNQSRIGEMLSPVVRCVEMALYVRAANYNCFLFRAFVVPESRSPSPIQPGAGGKKRLSVSSVASGASIADCKVAPRAASIDMVSEIKTESDEEVVS